MAETVELKVAMSCQGCVGAVNRVLTKMEGVESYNVDIEQQKVTVKGNVTPEAVFQTVSKTGKKTAFWEDAAVAPAVEEASPAAEAPAVEEALPAAKAPAVEETPLPAGAAAPTA